jgi:predicted small lipoprotein YifL
MRKSLILLVFLASLTACGDRERLHCAPTKNKALSAITETTTETTTAPRYAEGGKCR